MDVFFISWYKSHPNIMQLHKFVLKCRIMRPEVEFLNKRQIEITSTDKIQSSFHNEMGKYSLTLILHNIYN